MLARLLNGAARSGLIDVRTGSLDGSRSYAVRPPMLADALVAEQAFSAPVTGTRSAWPGRTVARAREPNWRGRPSPRQCTVP